MMRVQESGSEAVIMTAAFEFRNLKLQHENCSKAPKSFHLSHFKGKRAPPKDSRGAFCRVKSSDTGPPSPHSKLFNRIDQVDTCQHRNYDSSADPSDPATSPSRRCTSLVSSGIGDTQWGQVLDVLYQWYRNYGMAALLSWQPPKPSDDINNGNLSLSVARLLRADVIREC